MLRRKRIGRIAAVGGSLGALVAAAAGTAGQASAQDLDVVHVSDVVLQPSGTWKADAAAGSRVALDGTMVYAFATTPLTGTPGDGAGLPAGLTFATQDGCKPAPQTTAVYLCNVAGTAPYAAPMVALSPQTPDNTTGYYGAVYAPSGSDLNTAIQAAQTAGATPADGTHGAGTFTVKTLQDIAQNTLTFHSPDITAGKTTSQTLQVHAVDAGHLDLAFYQTPGQLDWLSHNVDIRVSSMTADPAANCTYNSAESISVARVVIRCDLEPGDTDLTYALTAAAGTESWHIDTTATYRVYTYGSDYLTAQSTFAVDGPPVHDWYKLLGRDTAGNLWQYVATGKQATPLTARSLIGGGWQGYTALTKLSPLPVNLTEGDLVARDAAGILWYYRGTGTYSAPFAARTRVGAGWNTYNTLTGADDLTGDGKADLITRDTAGVLWLYRGTGNTTAPFTTRTRIGAGWNTYNTLTGTSDFTGDSKPDLITRDTTGTLWLYKGTGNATTPFTTRTKIGGGWNTYNQLVATGEPTADGKADLIARDTTGTLWLYKGTDNTAAPFTTRTRIGAGWNTYNTLT